MRSYWHIYIQNLTKCYILLDIKVYEFFERSNMSKTLFYGEKISNQEMTPPFDSSRWLKLENCIGFLRGTIIRFKTYMRLCIKVMVITCYCVLLQKMPKIEISLSDDSKLSGSKSCGFERKGSCFQCSQTLFIILCGLEVLGNIWAYSFRPPPWNLHPMIQKCN